ncbi:hypothetical protein C5S53_10160 [Methanophagales archaeon]|nr:hypothetical protein C5S53_10160 [Methanophagales archaeon]
MEELKGKSGNASRVGVAHLVKNEKLGGDR